MYSIFFFFFKQKTAYEMRISDWSSDVCSSDLSEEEILAEELALGPQLAGRVLGAAPLWPDAQAQRRVNLIGRWMASQTTRPDLPWTFGVIDSHAINALAAPGGYVLCTPGMSERSEGRRVGQAWVRTCRSRGEPDRK